MTAKPDQPGGGIARRDELLEFLYWIEGEAIPGAATFDGIVRFLAQPPEQVQSTLADLVARGDATSDPATSEYRLTEPGRREAARRFAEEFAPLIGQGHGECNDPNCDCHSDPASCSQQP